MPDAPKRLPFLSDEWRAAVHALNEQQAGTPADQPGLVVNATVTGVPFGEGTLELHSERGPVVGWQEGHAADATFEIRVDYHTAKALVLNAASDEYLAQAFDAKAVEVLGDATAYRDWWRARIGAPGTAELESRIRAITA